MLSSVALFFSSFLPLPTFARFSAQCLERPVLTDRVSPHSTQRTRKIKDTHTEAEAVEGSRHLFSCDEALRVFAQRKIDTHTQVRNSVKGSGGDSADPLEANERGQSRAS